jgi:hypothetical protein
MPGGVHLSSGNYGTGSNLLLFLTGVSIMLVGAVGLALSYVALWGLEALTGLPLTETLTGLAGTADVPYYALIEVGVNLFVFTSFLLVMHLTPLAGYHGAEHKVVHCLEHFGILETTLARQSPRAHRRCGTNLLSAFLPIPLIAVPLLNLPPQWGVGPAVLVVVLGLLFRAPVGTFLQNVFTTKEPTDRELAAALNAGNLLLARWRRDPGRRLPLWRSLWVRGFPQMLLGVFVCMHLLTWIQQQLPYWLDFGHLLH